MYYQSQKTVVLNSQLTTYFKSYMTKNIWDHPNQIKYPYNYVILVLYYNIIIISIIVVYLV